MRPYYYIKPYKYIRAAANAVLHLVVLNWNRSFISDCACSPGLHCSGVIYGFSHGRGVGESMGNVSSSSYFPNRSWYGMSLKKPPLKTQARKPAFEAQVEVISYVA